MKLYALRDRLIGYYLQPFTGPDEHGVKASLAETINGDVQHALTKSPHHFELHELAEIDQETGKVTPTGPKLIADCSSLIREDIRETGAPGAGPHARAAPGRSRTSYGGDRITTAQTGTSATKAPTNDLQAAEPRPEPNGVPGHSER